MLWLFGVFGGTWIFWVAGLYRFCRIEATNNAFSKFLLEIIANNLDNHDTNGLFIRIEE